MKNKRNILLIVLGCLLLGAFCVELMWMYRINTHPSEDAYITFRYARNLAEGFGLVFNLGDRVEGYSNFLWVLVLALIHKLGWDMISFSRAVGALCNLVSLGLVWFIPRRYFYLKGCTTLLGPLLYILFLPFHFYAASGLETSLFTCLLLLGLLVVFWAADRPLRFMAACCIFLLIAFTRPEGITYFIFLAAYILWRSISKQEPLKNYLPGIAFFVVCYGAFVLWRLNYFGLPFPNTYYAKSSFPFIARTFVGIFINKGFITHYPLLCLLPLTFIGFARLTVDKHLMTIIVLLAAGLGFSLEFACWDWMPYFRYNVPFVPFIILLCQIIFSKLWSTVYSTESIKQKYAWGCITAIFLFVAAEQYAADLGFNIRWVQLNNYAQHNYKVVGQWIKKELGSKPVIALGDVGRFVYFSDATVMDFYGLMDKEFAQLRKKYGAPDLDFYNFRFNFDSYKEKERRLLLQRAPDYIFLYNYHLKVSDTFPASAAGIVEHADFNQDYEYMATLPVFPDFESPYWPKLHYYIDIIDLSAGLLAWMKSKWAYDIYVRKDSPYKRFTFEFNPDGRIRRVIEQTAQNFAARK